jgi:hypothetical protein
MKKYFKLGFVLLIVFLGGLFVNVGKVRAAASLSFSPSSKSVAVGESFTVDILLDTKGAETDAVDAIVLYDSAKLEATGASLRSLYENKLEENTGVTGKVILRATSSATSGYSGSGTLATITFNCLESGTANVSFEFESGSTTDSNVASEGVDILGSVSNGAYTITSGGIGGTGDDSSTDSGTSTTSPEMPETASIGPTILVFGIGFLAIFASLVFTGAKAFLLKN